MKVNVRSNARQIARRMGHAGSNQIPFATSRAINDTLFDMRKKVTKESFPRAFPQAPNKTFINAAMRVDKTTKRNLNGAVFDRFEYNWLDRQAKGGIKRPFSSSSLAIPRYKARNGPRRTRMGAAKSHRPARLLQNKKKFFSGKPKGFPTAASGIWKREGPKGRKNIRLWYVYRRDARVLQGFPGYEDAQSIARKNFDRHFRKRMRQAMASAKAREARRR